MKFFVSIIFAAAVLLTSCGKGNVDNLSKPKEYNDKVSYMIGKDIGNSFIQQNLNKNINMDYLLLGLKHGMAQDSTFMSSKELDSLRMKFQEQMMKVQNEKMKQDEEKWKSEGVKNKAEGEKFLAENKNKPGVITTNSGLQYMVIKEGSGKTPVSDDQIKIHLKGYYLDGKEFDNTYNRQPAEISVSASVPGWQEVFKMMKEGSIYRFWLPPALGWGEMGARPTIPANAVLIFEVELLQITGKTQEQGRAGQPR